MPKVSNIRVKIDGEVQQFDIYYNKSDGFHLRSFPESIMLLTSRMLRRDFYGCSTELELTNKVHVCINTYHELTKETRRVIAYSLHASSDVAMICTEYANGSYSYSGHRDGISKSVQTGNSNSDYNIGFTYRVLLETNKNGKQYNEIKSDGSIGYRRDIDNRDIVIDWTQEREEAFKMLADGMYQLMVKICSALGDEQKAISFIDSKLKLIQ